MPHDAQPQAAAAPQKLIRMANQIAAFFATQPGAGQEAALARHLNAYWEPRMRQAFLDHVAAGGAGLDPLVLRAAGAVNPPATRKH